MSQPLMDPRPARSQRLIVSGWVGATEVRRGMRVAGQGGTPLGFVACIVIVGDDDRRVTHLLVGDLPPTGDYRLVPANVVTYVVSDEVGVGLEAAELAALPRHNAD